MRQEIVLTGQALTRRRFLRMGAFSAAWLSMPGSALAGLMLKQPAQRALSFYNTHTGETLSAVYFEDGAYVGAAMRAIWHILRDFRTNQVKAIEPGVLDLLSALSHQLDTREPFHIISGYRSPATNAMLAAHSEGVARHSLHMEGKAVDIRVPGRDLATVHAAAVALRGGGVGYYPAPDFVHVDIGRVRYW